MSYPLMLLWSIKYHRLVIQTTPPSYTLDMIANARRLSITIGVI